MSYISFITSPENYAQHKASVQSDPSIIEALEPDTFSEKKYPDHRLILIYWDGVAEPSKALAYDNTGYNLGGDLYGNDFVLAELQTTKGRLWVNTKLEHDCVPAAAASDGRIQSSLVFASGNSYLVLGSVDEVKAALKLPIDVISFAPPEKPAAETEEAPTAPAEEKTEKKQSKRPMARKKKGAAAESTPV